MKSSEQVAGQAVKPRRQGHVIGRRPLISLNEPGLLRMADILGLLGIAHTTYYDHAQRGLAPKPDGRDPGVRGRLFWRTETIRQFLATKGATPDQVQS